MTKQDRIDMEHEAEAYAEKYKTASPQEQSLIALAYLDGLKHGLKQHAHDYLVKTIGLKRKHEELEKENAELKMKIYGGGYEMIITKKDADIILLEKENAELKEDNDARKFAMAMSEKVEKQLREQIEKMKCCYNCDNWHWKHKKCEKKLKGDCFKTSKWILRR